jgi:hypothetical protein
MRFCVGIWIYYFFSIYTNKDLEIWEKNMSLNIETKNIYVYYTFKNNLLKRHSFCINKIIFAEYPCVSQLSVAMTKHQR